MHLQENTGLNRTHLKRGMGKQIWNKTEKSFSPIGCSIIDKYYRNVPRNVLKIVLKIVNKIVPKIVPEFFPETALKFSTKLFLKLSSKCPQSCSKNCPENSQPSENLKILKTQKLSIWSIFFSLHYDIAKHSSQFNLLIITE